MSMGHAACYADVIDGKHILKFCPREYEALIEVIAASPDYALDDVAKADYNSQLDEDINDKAIIAALNGLCKAFSKKTGLSLYLGYHNSDDEGDCYDDVNGAYWGINGMRCLTPAGKRMRKYVQEQRWVVYG